MTCVYIFYKKPIFTTFLLNTVYREKTGLGGKDHGLLQYNTQAESMGNMCWLNEGHTIEQAMLPTTVHSCLNHYLCLCSIRLTIFILLLFTIFSKLQSGSFILPKEAQTSKIQAC